MTYTAVTFAPIQSFIQASRKLRDLYGSSLLLSHLARALADDATAKKHRVISPADVSSSRGVPNFLVIAGDYRRGHARDALLAAWKQVLHSCRGWLEDSLAGSDLEPEDWERAWGGSWRAVGQHSWEFFHGQGSTIQEARQVLAVHKLQRDWSAPNWTGESSTLSSTEAVVRPSMGLVIDPRDVDPARARDEARAFMAVLREKLGEAFASENEELSLSELVKRLVTYRDIAPLAFATQGDPSPAANSLLPERFQKTSVSGEGEQKAESIIWFMADGDRIGEHLQSLGGQIGEEKALQSFSRSMREWAASLYVKVPRQLPQKAMVVYAGGDDVFGALHESEAGKGDLSVQDLWRWLEAFPELWKECRQPGLTVSMGLVWASAAVPQRDALQHAREAEASAKARGRNRFALRLLYASGNHLEWSCPWSWLTPIREHYRDREGRSGDAARWRHLADDLAWLRSRQAIGSGKSDGTAVAEALLEAYFPGWRPPEPPEPDRSLAAWLIDLGRVMAGLEKRREQRLEVSL
jgi:CRISPR-associated protein Cmr2